MGNFERKLIELAYDETDSREPSAWFGLSECVFEIDLAVCKRVSYESYMKIGYKNLPMRSDLFINPAVEVKGQI